MGGGGEINEGAVEMDGVGRSWGGEGAEVGRHCGGVE